MNTDRSHAAQGLLTAAVEAIHLAVQNEDVLRNSSTAIRLILLACDDDQRPLFAEDELAVLDNLIRLSAPQIVKACGFGLEAEEIYLGLSALCGLVADLLARPGVSRLAADELVQARFNHSALLSDELDAIYRRHEIERRGDVLRRHIAFSRFQRAAAFGQSLQ